MISVLAFLCQLQDTDKQLKYYHFLSNKHNLLLEKQDPICFQKSSAELHVIITFLYQKVFYWLKSLLNQQHYDNIHYNK